MHLTDRFGWQSAFWQSRFYVSAYRWRPVSKLAANVSATISEMGKKVGTSKKDIATIKFIKVLSLGMRMTNEDVNEVH